MLFHTQFVLAALTGWRLDWKSPPRDDASTSWREAASRHGAHTVLALLWIAAIVLSSDSFAWWLTPILLGLLAAMPLSVWGSRVAVGRALCRSGLLLTPEEVREPRVLGTAAREAAAVEARLATFKAAVGEADVHERVVTASPVRREASGPKAAAEAARIERALREGPDALSLDERFRLLSSPRAMAALRAEVLAHRAHPAWWQATRPLPVADTAREESEGEREAVLAGGL
jgi:membrane glycosyltransferase